MAQVLGRLNLKPHPSLLVGFERKDDASVYALSEDYGIVMTTDFFTPIVDDPYDFGRIAATNALSDVYAMGGRPLSALNLVAYPTKTRSIDELTAILQGGADVCAEADCALSGGHTIELSEIVYGLAVSGVVHPKRIWKNGGVRAGDALIVTKPLGTGLVSSAVKADELGGPLVEEATRWMTTLNGRGIEHLHAADIGAVTDITGFGLVGHACELADGSGTRLVIDAEKLPRFAGIERVLDARYVTGGAKRNRSYTSAHARIAASADPWSVELAFDPQTSGGLLVSVAAAQAEDLARRLRDAGLEYATVVGEARPADSEIRVELH